MHEHSPAPGRTPALRASSQASRARAASQAKQATDRPVGSSSLPSFPCSPAVTHLTLNRFARCDLARLSLHVFCCSCIVINAPSSDVNLRRLGPWAGARTSHEFFMHVHIHAHVTTPVDPAFIHSKTVMTTPGFRQVVGQCSRTCTPFQVPG